MVGSTEVAAASFWRGNSTMTSLWRWSRVDISVAQCVGRRQRVHQMTVTSTIDVTPARLETSSPDHEANSSRNVSTKRPT